ncbi:MAG: endonuclease/exonuclease/phosphatase family protein, partial [Bacteroidota bacterium]
MNQHQLVVPILILISTLLCTSWAEGQTVVEIWQIQGSNNISPYNRQAVATRSNVVILIGSNHLYIQTPADRADGDMRTSDGIRVNLGGSHSYQVGDVIDVDGSVLEIDGTTMLNSTLSQTRLISQQGELPEPILLDENFPQGIAQVVPELEAVEGMLVRVDNALVNGPTRNGMTPITAKQTRRFREAGVEYPGQFNLPLWDGNPEVFFLNPIYLNSSPLLSGDMRVSGFGVMEADGNEYEFRAADLETSGSPKSRAVPDRGQQQATIGSFNALFFEEGSGNFNIRLQKVSRFVVEIMKAPDVLAMQEVANLRTLERLADAIRALDPDIQYTPYLLGTSGSIKTGYLLRRTLSNVNIRQLGANQFLSIGGRVHDRPPLLLEAKFNTDPPTPIQVLNLHLRSLRGIEGNDSNFVRTKRFEQAVSVGRMVQSLGDENLVVLGDFNAFEFSDGYVDVLSIISGQSSIGAERSSPTIVNPALSIQTAQVEPEERYSFVFDGNAQILDHILTNDLDRIQVAGLSFARGNADNSELYLNNPNNLFRVSDHDAPVLFLDLEETPTLTPTTTPPGEFSIQFPNPFTPQNDIRLFLPEPENLALQLFAADGRLIYELPSTGFPEGPLNAQLPADLPTAMYFLRLQRSVGSETFKLFY